MKTSDFDYYLPEELIAQSPLKNRSDSRLIVVHKNNGKIEDNNFYNIIDYLHEGDVLVLNDTKVIPARIIGVKDITNATIELLLLKDKGNDIWECMSKPAKRLKIGTIIKFSDKLSAQVTAKFDDGIVNVQLIYKGILMNILDELGNMPLPPYIHEKLKDKTRYQTVYAKNIGSSAAPTAGLHFTDELLKKIKNKGVIIEYITLHVGLGTFRPVQVEDIKKHKMHSEYFHISSSTADTLNKAKLERRRIIAVGTTVTRTLETVMMKHDTFLECRGETDIFIYPGFKFKAIDALITNFHLPKSTLLMLVSAFSSKYLILKSYQHAIEEKYRFFSFGDSMFITND